MADLTDLKKHENDLFKKWRTTQDVKHFQDLYKSMKPAIYSAARKASFGSNIPESAHRAYAAQNFLGALKTFDPTKGRQLSSHVYDTVHQKAKRLNYLYQNLGHMPEPRMQQVGLYQAERENLRAELGRDPTAAELSDRLGWGVSDVQKMQVELRKDLAMDEGTEDAGLFESNKDEETLEYLYFDLPQQEKQVFDYLYGKRGKPRMVKANGKIDYDQIGRVMGVSSSKVRQIVTNIKTRFTTTLRK